MNPQTRCQGSHCCGEEKRETTSAAREYWIAGLALASGAALGAAAMYITDPDRGKARRARIQEKAESAARQTGRQFAARAEDVLHRAKGMAARAGAAVCRSEVNDDVLEARIRSRLGHLTQHAHTVETRVKDGSVTLRGIIPEGERNNVVAELENVSGVKKVEDQLACALTS